MIKNLLLHNFRNYAHAEIAFHPKTNLFLGKNGQGKTNLLEALFILSTGKSFRTPSLSDAIFQGENSFYLEATIFQEGTEETLSLEWQAVGKKISSHNGKTKNSLLGIFPLVLSTPMDIAMIFGPPQERRKFLNFSLVQSDPLYIHHSLRYQKCLKERNTLLRQEKEDLLSIYEEEMAKSAFYITTSRAQLIHDLQQNAQKYFQKITASKNSLFLKYQSSISHEDSYEKKLQEQLKKNRYRDKKLGYTHQGPHRDDLAIYLDDCPLKMIGSEGQKRLAIFSMRFAEWQLLKEKTKNQIPLLLDDFSAFLDEPHQHTIQKSLLELDQVLITTCTDLLGFNINEGKNFTITRGEIQPST